jgi:LysM repeat protein
MAVLAVAVVVGVLHGAGAAVSVTRHVVTVGAGQTLSQIAVAELPSLTIPEAVAQIQLANALTTTQVHAGQELVIPALG